MIYSLWAFYFYKKLKHGLSLSHKPSKKEKQRLELESVCFLGYSWTFDEIYDRVQAVGWLGVEILHFRCPIL